MRNMFFIFFILLSCETNQEYSEECISCLLKQNEELIIQLRSFDAMLKEDGLIKGQADYLNLVSNLEYNDSLMKVELVYSPANVAYFINCVNASVTYQQSQKHLMEIILAPSQYLLPSSKKTRASENYKQFLSGKLNQIKVEDLKHEIYRLSILFACWPIAQGM